MDRKANSQQVSWFVDMRNMGRLNLDPPYQRKSVWNDQFRRFFLDTILRGFPCPTLFLVKEYDANLNVRFGVVDGKQRISTIFSFLDGQLQTQQCNDREDISEKCFDELRPETKKKFLDYELTVETLNNWTEVGLREAFDRMNRNVSKLNDQELRHARYSGAFISLCEEFSKHPFWEGSSIATTRRVERMSDVEFVSELVVLTERGVQGGKAVLDEVYAQYDEEIPDEAALRGAYHRIFDILVALGLSATARDPFGKPVDIYSIWAALQRFFEENDELDVDASRTQLEALHQEVENKTSDEGLLYYLNAQRQTNSSSSRLRRADIIFKRLVSR